MKVQIKLHGSETPAFYAIQPNQPLTIGRAQSVNCPISDTKISSNHCQLILNDKGIELIDLKSKNGTYVNGLKISRMNIYIGDEIRVGDTRIILDPSKMDQEAVKLLTYRGGASRLESQLQVDVEVDPEAVAIAKGIIKNKIVEETALSPAQIRKKYRGLFFGAIIINVGILIAILATTTFIFKGNKHLGIYQIVITALFFLVNFKILKFSIGEKILGLERKYIIQ